MKYKSNSKQKKKKINLDRSNSRSSDEYQRKPINDSISDSDEPKEEIDLTYGRHAVLAALKSDRQINRIWLTDTLMAHGQFYPLIKEAKADGTIINDVDSRS